MAIRTSKYKETNMRFDWKIILATVLAIHVGIGTADAGLLHDMEDIGKGVVVGAAVHEGEKFIARDAEIKAAEESAGKIYSKHSIGGRTVYKNVKINPYTVDKNNISNIDRMHQGKPPVDEDGKPYNVHHVIQEEPGPVAELRESVHRKFHGILHGLKKSGESFRKDKKLVSDFEAYKKAHWKSRAKDYGEEK
jgi:hypothetical protein